MYLRRLLRIVLVASLALAVCGAGPAVPARPQQPVVYGAAARSRLLEYVGILNEYRDGHRLQAFERLAKWPDVRFAVLELASFPTTLQRFKRKVVDVYNETADGVTRKSYDVATFIADPEAPKRSGWGPYRTLEGEWSVYTLPEIAAISEALGFTPAHETIAPYLRLAAFIHADFAQYCWVTKKDIGNGAYHWELAALAIGPLEAVPSERPFVRAWYLATIVGTVSAAAFTQADLFIERAAALFPDDPDFALARGCFYETLAMIMTRPITILAPPGCAVPDSVGCRGKDLHVKTPAENLAQAETHLRRAVALGAGPSARLRLGHVLVLEGRASDALEQLDLARAEAVEQARKRFIPEGPKKEALVTRALAQDRALLYQVMLVRGTALEAAGDVAGARQAYSEAAVMFPAAQAPFIALSHLAARDQADRQGPMLALEPGLAMTSDDYGRDPWWRYRYGNTWDLYQLYDALWDMVFK